MADKALACTDDGLFVFVCTYEDREMPKKAGFKWEPARKQWCTKYKAVAMRLYAYATPKAKLMLGEHRKETEAFIKDSFASETDVQIPCPKGQELMPYQRAGVAYILRKWGIIR